MSRSRGRRSPARYWITKYYPNYEKFALDLCTADRVPWKTIAKQLKKTKTSQQIIKQGGLASLIVWGASDYYNFVRMLCLGEN